MRFSRARFAFGLLALTAAGCVMPARSDSAFEGKSVEAVHASRSAVETSLLVVDEIARGRLTDAFASTALADAEQDATAAQSSFDSVQPPSPRSDALRERADGLLADAVSTLAPMRIAARRGDLPGVVAQAGAARHVADELAQYEQAHE